LPPKSWIQCKLGEYAEITMGQSPESTHYSSNPEDVPFLQGNRTFGSKYPHFDTYTSKVTKLAVKNSVLLSVRAPVGDVNIAPNDVCLGRGVSGLTSIDVTNEFLYYLLRNLTPVLNQNENGSTFGSINKSDLESLPILLPDITTRNKIATILSTIDSKIEINREINANLLRQMESIYCNLMDFSKYNNLIETELGPMPDNWHVEQVSKYCKDMKNGATPSRSKNEYWVNGTIPWVVTGEVNDSIIIDTEEKITDLGLKNSSAKLLPVDTVVMAMYGRGTAARLAYLKIEAATNQACCGMICDTPNRSAFLYETLHQMHDYIDTLASGSVQQNLSKEIIGNLKFPCPPDDIIESLELSMIFDVITNNDPENKRLIELRDYLLPKLMSGEIDVSQLDLGD